MPKPKKTEHVKLRDFIKMFGTETFSTAGGKLFCKQCCRVINHEKKYFITQHLNTDKHKSAAKRIKLNNPSTSTSTNESGKSQFSVDLCSAFVDADIPKWKLENSSLRTFLLKYTLQSVPPELKALKKKNKASNFDIQKIIDEIGNSGADVMDQSDETGKYIASVVLGTMDMADSANTVTGRRSQFSMDLCNAFIDADIPLWKLENKSLRSFLMKYTRENIPTESTLRKNYVDPCYELAIQKIRDNIGEGLVWVSVAATTDVTSRHVCNVVIGTMSIEYPSKRFLLTCETMESLSSTNVVQTLTKALNYLWPYNFQHEKVILFLTNDSPFMKEAGRTLKVFFPNMLHLTCLSQALNRVAEEICTWFSNVNKLITNVEKLFLDNPNFADLFHNIAPDLSLPPQPALTRWETWISAAIYYSSNLDRFMAVLSLVEREENSYISIIKQLVHTTNVKADLSYIAVHFSKLPNAINSVEDNESTMMESLKAYDDFIQEVTTAPSELGRNVLHKCDILTNPDLDGLRKISHKLFDLTDEQLDKHNLACFKYVPTSTVDVDKSLLRLQLLLSDKRRRKLNFENLKKLLVISYNSN